MLDSRFRGNDKMLEAILYWIRRFRGTDKILEIILCWIRSFRGNDKMLEAILYCIQSVVLTAKESKEVEASEAGIEAMVHELIEEKTIA